MGANETKTGNNTKIWIAHCIILALVYNAIKFLGIEGNSNPLVGLLFNLIILLTLLILLFHRKELIENNMNQSHLEDYFKKQNKK